MKNTFGGWAHVHDKSIDEVSDLIVTGRKANEATPDTWLTDYLGDRNKSLKVLDFGCGFGRNAFWLSNHCPFWTIIGYDNEAMILRTGEFSKIKYNGQIPFNLHFETDWCKVKETSFDVIYCTLVLQHIGEQTLTQYLSDFKKMTKRLIVAGRRYNDDKNRSTWKIIEEAGLLPDMFYSGNTCIQYKAEGDPHDHNFGIYTIKL